jgi:hypothetical protein
MLLPLARQRPPDPPSCCRPGPRIVACDQFELDNPITGSLLRTTTGVLLRYQAGPASDLACTPGERPQR